MSGLKAVSPKAAAAEESQRGTLLAAVSRLIRRVHMYLALVLAPWILMYALSTMAMNHRSLFRKDGAPPPLQIERVLSYSSPLPPGAGRAETARRILSDLGLEGVHSVNVSPDRRTVTIIRVDPITPRRITYTPADGRLVIEKQAFEMPAFLERMHRRRGFQRGYWMQNAWAASVDFVILAIVFWAASGVWMWWTLKRTRLLGAVFLGAGLLLFTFFLLTS
jgi:hypothetical protein